MNEVDWKKDGEKGCLFALCVGALALGASMLMFGVVLAWVL